MKIALAGYRGFLGSELIQRGSEHDFVTIDRSALYGDIIYLKDLLEGCDILVNFSGAPVIQRWSGRNKKIIWDSRVIVTENLVKALNLCKGGPELFILGSAIGIYDFDSEHTEASTAFGTNFLSELVLAWEAALKSLEKRIKVAVVRTGLVLGASGGMFPKVLKASVLLPSVIPGSGNQPFPFIHIKDYIRGIFWIIDNNSEGIYNFVAPAQVDYKTFIFSLESSRKRRCVIRIPAFIITFFIGAAGIMLIRGQKVLAERLLAEGFVFEFVDIKSAILDLLKETR